MTTPELRTPSPEAISGVRIPTVVAAHPRTSGTLLAELVARAEALRSEQAQRQAGAL